LKAVLVATAMLFQLVASGSQVATASDSSGERSACASLSLAFYPRTVTPGQAMDYYFDLSNCGTVAERLTVRLDPTGPCRFLPRSKRSYVLEPNQGFAVSALMIGPSCPGDYLLRGDVEFGGRTLDRAVASFRVRPSNVTRSIQ
jgi:hypothetical protein